MKILRRLRNSEQIEKKDRVVMKVLGMGHSEMNRF